MDDRDMKDRDARESADMEPVGMEGAGETLDAEWTEAKTEIESGAGFDADAEFDVESEMESDADFDAEFESEAEADAGHESSRKSRHNGQNKKAGFFGGILEKVGMLPGKIGPAMIKFRNMDFPEKINLPKWMGPVSRMTLPNQLTLLRIVLIPVFLGILYWGFPGSRYVALAVFLLASLTDWLDGQIARKRNLITDFGKFADPLADKMLVTAAMLWFVERGLMPGWALAVVICREFAVSGLRMVAAEKGRVIAAGLSGKIKTAATMICVILMFFPLAGWLNALCVTVITLTTLYSGIEYFLKNRDMLAGA